MVERPRDNPFSLAGSGVSSVPIVLRRQFDDKRCLLSIEGELRHHNTEQLINEVFKLFEFGIKELVLDWRKVDYCDTAGLQTLVQIYKYVQDNPELSFTLYAEEGSLMDTLRTCRFDKFITITQDQSSLSGDWHKG